MPTELNEFRSKMRPATHTTKKVMMSAGTSVPSDGVAGYAPGCHFLKASASDIQNASLYINVGTAASANFDPFFLNTVAAPEIKDASGNIMIASAATTAVPTGAGYMARGLYINTAGSASTSMSDSWYINIGGSGTADFNAITLTVAS